MDRNARLDDIIRPMRFQRVELALLVRHNMPGNPISADQLDITRSQDSRTIRCQSPVAQPAQRSAGVRQSRFVELWIAGVLVPARDRFTFDVGTVGEHSKIPRGIVASSRQDA